jgi:hypothetical protein
VLTEQWEHFVSEIGDLLVRGVGGNTGGMDPQIETRAVGGS